MQSQHHYQQRSKLPVYASMICGIAMLFYFFDYFIQVSPSVMTQPFMQHFHINARDLGVLGACFYYSYLLMQIPAGILLDKFGARIMISVAILTCTAGVVLVGQTNSFFLACVGRSLTGIGSAFSFIGAIYLIATWFSERYFASLLGLTQSGAALGSLFGLIPIAYGVSHIGWIHTLDLMAAAAFILALLSIVCIRDHPQSLKYESKTINWYTIRSILQNKQVWLIAFLGFCSWTPVAAIGTLWGVPYLMKSYNLSTIQASEICSFFWIGLGILSPLIGWIADRYQKKKACMVAAFMIASIAAISLLTIKHIHIFIVSLLLFFLSAAPSAQALTFSLIKDQVPATQLGYASGLNNMAAVLGGAFAQTLIGIVLYNSLNNHSHNLMIYSLHAYHVALSIMPECLIIGFLASLYLTTRKTIQSKSETSPNISSCQTANKVPTQLQAPHQEPELLS